MFPKLSEHPTQMPNVFLLRPTKDENVIKIYCHKAIKCGTKYLVHKSLKSRRGIAQSEGEYEKLVQSPTAGECRAKLMPRLDGHLMVSCLEVDLGENLSPPKTIQDLVYARNRISVDARVPVK